MKIDPVELTADLIRCRSVTPAEGAPIALQERLLAESFGELPDGHRQRLRQVFRRIILTPDIGLDEEGVAHHGEPKFGVAGLIAELGQIQRSER